MTSETCTREAVEISVKEMSCVTVEQVLALRERAVKLEQEVVKLKGYIGLRDKLKGNEGKSE